MRVTRESLLLMTVLMVLALACGCASRSSYESLRAKNDALRKENADLRREVEELKFGAEHLLSEAQRQIAAGQYATASTNLRELLRRHPDSAEAKRAKPLLTQAQQALARQRLAQEKTKREREAAERTRVAKAVDSMRVEVDDMRGITWHYSKLTPKRNDCKNVHIYFGREGKGTPFLRFRIRYAANDWLFIEGYLFKVDGVDYQISASLFEVERDNGYGGIWEWYDVRVTGDVKAIVSALANAKQAKLRYDGKQYHSDRAVSSGEIKAIRDVLTAYKALGGEW